MNGWTCALELDDRREPARGSPEALCRAIGRGADLRCYTEFRHNEHIDVTSDNPEKILESMDFRVTYLVEERWVAGVITLRQPVSLPDGFGARPSMSFFLYNQDARQAVARPFLDGQPAPGPIGPSPAQDPVEMPKYHVLDAWDQETNAPSSNFVYDFDVYRFWVRDEWREVLRHDEAGRVQSGSVDDLVAAFAGGAEVKVGIRGLCVGLAENPGAAPAHEVFGQTGPCYHYSERRLFIAASHPVVRVRPGIPVAYASRGWDFGWLVVRTDGEVVYRRCDPYTLAFADVRLRLPVRWFVR